MSHYTTPEILERLVGFPSVFTAEDYCAIADFSVSYLRDLGFSVHRLAGSTAGRAGLFASLGPAGRGGVLLSAHLDVVPVEGQKWTVDPFRLTRRDGRFHGRGTTDMKGFAAAALAAAARAASGPPLAQPLKIAFSYDEEAGCVGMAEMIDRLDATIGIPDVCMVGEPTSMQVAIGHKGKTSYRIRFFGSAGHSASAPHYANAIHIAAEVVGILRAVQARLEKTGARDSAYDVPFTTVHVGTLSGGTALNIVPDHAELEFEIRYLASEAHGIIDEIEREISDLVRRWRVRHPEVDVGIEEINSYPGIETSQHADVVRWALSLGGRGPVTKVSYGTEAGFFRDKWGIPTIVCGPGDMAQGHKPDEYIEEKQLTECDAMLSSVIHSLASVDREERRI